MREDKHDDRIETVNGHSDLVVLHDSFDNDHDRRRENNELIRNALFDLVRFYFLICLISKQLTDLQGNFCRTLGRCNRLYGHREGCGEPQKNDRCHLSPGRHSVLASSKADEGPG
jgi:hypothetical protein